MVLIMVPDIANPFWSEIARAAQDVDTVGTDTRAAARLGATEVDLDFNINVKTHSDGTILDVVREPCGPPRPEASPLGG